MNVSVENLTDPFSERVGVEVTPGPSTMILSGLIQLEKKSRVISGSFFHNKMVESTVDVVLPSINRHDGTTCRGSGIFPGRVCNRPAAVR